MDFYFDIGMAVILRILKDRKSVAKYYAALAKLFLALRNAADLSPELAAEIQRRDTRV